MCQIDVELAFCVNATFGLVPLRDYLGFYELFMNIYYFYILLSFNHFCTIIIIIFVLKRPYYALVQSLDFVLY